MKSRAKKAAAFALSGAMVGVLAGCGAPANNYASAAASSSGSSAPIVVGLIAGTTGAYGSTGVATVRGAQMAIDKLNAQGGVLGRKFKLEWYNDNASATLSAQLFQKLVSAGAVAIVGSPDTGPTTAAEADRYQIPDIGAVDDGGLTVYPNGPTKPPLPWVFDFGLNTFAWGGKIAQYSLQHHLKLAMVQDPTSYGEGGAYGIKMVYDAAHKSLALDNKITEDWSTGATTDLTSQLNAIKASGANAVDVWLTPQDQAAFVQAAHTLGDKFTIFGNDETNADNTYASLAGKLADGTISAMLTSELFPSPAMKAFTSAYQKRFNAASTPFAETTYDSVMMLAKAIKMAKSTSPQALQKAFNSISHFKGITGDLGFNPKKHLTINAEQLTLVKYSAAKHKWLPLH